MIAIRLLNAADLPIVRQWMEGAPEAPSWGENDLPALAEPCVGEERKQRQAWVAEDASCGLCGFAVAASLSIPEAVAECEIEFIYVIPELRRRGVGRKLLSVIVGWAHSRLAAEIWLEVRESNVSAIALYERCGFGSVGRRPAYYAHPEEAALRMRRTIRRPRGSSRAGTPV